MTLKIHVIREWQDKMSPAARREIGPDQAGNDHICEAEFHIVRSRQGSILGVFVSNGCSASNSL